MSIMQRVKNYFGVSFGVPGPENWDNARQWVRAADTLRSPDTLEQPYAQVGPYQRVISVIARDAASVPWEFYQVDSRGVEADEPLDHHPVLDLWQRPNKLMLGNQLMIGSYISKLVFGEWIWYYPDLQFGSRRGPRSLLSSNGEIQLLNPMAVRRKLEGGVIRYWVRRPDGGEDELDKDKLTHSIRWSPYSRIVGLPLAGAIIHELLGYHSAAAWNARFFNEQNGVPTVLLTPAQGAMLSPDALEDFQGRWANRHARRRSFGVLPAGWTAQDFGATQRDMDFNELQQFGRDEVLAVAGVPPLIAGYLTRSVTYNADEQKKVYWDSTVEHFLAEEQAVINFDFLPKIGVAERVWPKWEVVQAILENLAEKTDIALKWFGMGIPKSVINERLEMGWDPDQIEDYEQAYLPMNIAPVGLVLEPPEPVAQTPPTEPDEEQVDRSYPPQSEEHKALVWRSIVMDDATRSLEQQFGRMIRAYFKAIRGEVVSNLETVKGWRMRVEKQEPESLFDMAKALDRIVRQARVIYEKAVQRGGSMLLASLGTETAFNLTGPPLIAVLTELLARDKGLRGITDSVARDIRRELHEGLAQNESVDKLRDRVRKAVDVSLSRARTIAQTEVGAAFNAGRFEGMRQAGVRRHQWLSSRDPITRDTHAPGSGVDSEIRQVGEVFSNGCRWPQDTRGAAAEVINCRCVALPIVEV